MNEGTGQASVATGEATATTSVDTTPQTQSNVDTGQVATFSRESSTSNTADTTNTTDAPISTEGKWYLSEGVEGKGEIPEWFKPGTFKTVEAQAEGYAKLQAHHQKSLGGFTGAPEGDYNLALNETASELGIELNSDDPNIAQFAEFAKSNNMNQETFTELLSMSQMANHQATQESAEAVINAVNENVDVQLAEFGEQNKEKFVQAVNMAANMPGVSEEGLNDVLDGITTANGLKTFIDMVNSSNPSSIPSTPGEVSYNDHNSLRTKLAEVKKMSGPARADAEKALNAEYAKMFPGNRSY